ncbi:MAG: glycerol-3-phosphate 1-O-acyltransferase PlsY [Gammaproteobacteria bacterium]|jgi:glycerol-3-phosphate acyltransferase PlsY
MIATILLTIGSYLIGSLSAAIIICRLLRLPDPRTQGSRNPGATNVLRIAGKKTAALVLVGDVLKGLIPLVIARALHLEDHVLAAVGLAAFLGHLYPVYFGFHGGKGVATALGILLGLSWPLAAAVLATWLFMARVFHISSLSAVTAAVMAPLYTWLLMDSTPLLVMVCTISTMLLWRHRGNIQRLLSGTEGRLGQ